MDSSSCFIFMLPPCARVTGSDAAGLFYDPDGRLIKIVHRSDHFVLYIISFDKIAPRGEFMVGDVKLVEKNDVAVAKEWRHHRQREQRGRIEIRIHVEYAGRVGRIFGVAVIVEEFVESILEQPLDKGSPLVFQKGDVETECPFLKEMPVFGQTFEGVESKKPGIGMVIGLYPPHKRSAAGYPEFQVMDGPICETLAFDHGFMQIDPPGILAQRSIKVRIRGRPAHFIHPG